MTKSRLPTNHWGPGCRGYSFDGDQLIGCDNSSLSRFLATIRCGHSYCNFFNQQKPLASALFDRRTRLPFYFMWVDGRMVVTADPSMLGVPVGAEVLTINGVPAPSLLRTLMPYARADGHNDAKRASLLSVTEIGTIEYFDVFHGLVFGAPASSHHRVTLRFINDAEMRLVLPAIDLTERQAQRKRGDYMDADPFWSWTERPEGVSVLTRLPHSGESEAGQIIKSITVEG
jgi:hypothetical protein